jgi:hypothetical protein
MVVLGRSLVLRREQKEMVDCGVCGTGDDNRRKDELRVKGPPRGDEDGDRDALTQTEESEPERSVF